MNDLRALALETSGRIGSLAALRQKQDQLAIVCTKELPDDRRTAQALLPTIRELLEECDWIPAEVELVCTTTGPGSFTGLRLGVVTAKTLAYATGAELVGVSTLVAIAAGVPTKFQQLWAILDAQRQEIFATRFVEGWQENSEYVPEVKVHGIDDWLRQLQPGDAVAGPPLKKLLNRLPSNIHVVYPEFWMPRAATVGKLGMVAHRRGQTVDPMQLVPQYFRKSAAEEKAEITD